MAGNQSNDGYKLFYTFYTLLLSLVFYINSNNDNNNNNNNIQNTEKYTIKLSIFIKTTGSNDSKKSGRRLITNM